MLLVPLLFMAFTVPLDIDDRDRRRGRLHELRGRLSVVRDEEDRRRADQIRDLVRAAPDSLAQRHAIRWFLTSRVSQEDQTAVGFLHLLNTLGSRMGTGFLFSFPNEPASAVDEHEEFTRMAPLSRSFYSFVAAITRLSVLAWDLARRGPHALDEALGDTLDGLTFPEVDIVDEEHVHPFANALYRTFLPPDFFSLVDYLRENPDLDVSAWSWERIRTEQHRWHERFVRKGFRDTLPAGPFVAVRFPDGDTIVRLLEKREFLDEGLSMGHCVGGDPEDRHRDGDSAYWRKTRDDRGAVYSYRRNDGLPEATLEVELYQTEAAGEVQPWVRVTQLQGPQDGPVLSAIAERRMAGFAVLVAGGTRDTTISLDVVQRATTGWKMVLPGGQTGIIVRSRTWHDLSAILRRDAQAKVTLLAEGLTAPTTLVERVDGALVADWLGVRTWLRRIFVESLLGSYLRSDLVNLVGPKSPSVLEQTFALVLPWVHSVYVNGAIHPKTGVVSFLGFHASEDLPETSSRAEIQAQVRTRPSKDPWTALLRMKDSPLLPVETAYDPIIKRFLQDYPTFFPTLPYAAGWAKDGDFHLLRGLCIGARSQILAWQKASTFNDVPHDTFPLWPRGLTAGVLREIQDQARQKTWTPWTRARYIADRVGGVVEGTWTSAERLKLGFGSRKDIALMQLLRKVDRIAGPVPLAWVRLPDGRILDGEHLLPISSLYEAIPVVQWAGLPPWS